MNWLCWHVGTVTDPKIGRIADACKTPRANVIALWAVILESAKDRRGQYSLDPDDTAYALGIDAQDVVDIHETMIERGLVDGFVVCKWEERQHGTSAERQRRHREKKKRKPRDRDAGDVTVTPTDITDNLLPNGNSAEPAPAAQTLKSQVFGPCLDWLSKASDRPADKLRSQVGRWCKIYGDALTIDCIVAAQRESPLDPVGWIEKTLKSKRGANGNGVKNGRDASSAVARTERRSDIVEGLGLDVSGGGGAGVGGAEGEDTGRSGSLPLALETGGDRGIGRAA